MAKSEIEVLIETLEMSRDLTKYYLNKLEGQDKYKVFEIEGKQLNSILWLVAHITVSENWLLLVCTGGERVKIPWARQFGLGSEIPKKENYPDAKEIMEMFDKVHTTAISYLNTLTEDDLAKPTTNGVNFGGEDSVRAIIKHAARHESTHAGHLGWLCKLFDVKTI
ncbi:MAG: DinB family protein [Flavobacteriales bacterium]|nr:DinB family protein [Flavobacteriales bacterium]MCB9364160.1 DinB family protein [Flavobacteriales bacterium]